MICCGVFGVVRPPVVRCLLGPSRAGRPKAQSQPNTAQRSRTCHQTFRLSPAGIATQAPFFFPRRDAPRNWVSLFTLCRLDKLPAPGILDSRGCEHPRNRHLRGRVWGPCFAGPRGRVLVFGVEVVVLWWVGVSVFIVKVFCGDGVSK